MGDVNLLDLVIMGVLILGAILGFRKGGVGEITRVVGLAIAFVFSMQLMKPVGLVVVSSLGLSDKVAPLAGFITTFLIIYGVALLLGRAIEKVLSTLKLGTLDKLIGGGVGALKYALLFSIGLLFVGDLGIPSQQMRQGSALYASVEPIAPATWDLLSRALPNAERLSEQVGRRFEHMIKEAPEAAPDPWEERDRTLEDDLKENLPPPVEGKE